MFIYSREHIWMSFVRVIDPIIWGLEKSTKIWYHVCETKIIIIKMLERRTFKGQNVEIEANVSNVLARILVSSTFLRWNLWMLTRIDRRTSIRHIIYHLNNGNLDKSQNWCENLWKTFFKFENLFHRHNPSQLNSPQHTNSVIFQTDLQITAFNRVRV